MNIVDMRLRPPLKSWVNQLQFTRGDDYYTKLGYDRPASTRTQSLDDLLGEMDRADVQWGVIMGRQSAAPLGVIPNDEIAQCIRQHPDRFVGWRSLGSAADPATELATALQRILGRDLDIG